MFTVTQIKAAHAKVQSGADFPNYIQEIKQLGVRAFETWVVDSHTDYFGNDNYQTSSEPVYAQLLISDTINKDAFSHALSIHQQGQTDYYAFCKASAATGIEKWVVNLEAMTCIYFDKSGNQVLVENIPA
ncbi:MULTISPECIES: DUF1398 family protein [unclassified Spirosoma]|uniref:DUF1398 domain-containing protein n=1 Tax=unclassified Spirosoma TaxID=2621999 RepID=UPI00095B30D2|nr:MULTISPECIES: DUF1398 family protein [unclassified Spirosoma]MBN8824985.1 DUF1398 family protein [Spirosoma sp.]OJW73280.1 MAG: phage envelope protein [Spirosoma sp. 48-14]